MSGAGLWIGYLAHSSDVEYLRSLFSDLVLDIIFIWNNETEQPEGLFGFVDHDTAKRNLQKYNGTSMPGTTRAYDLKWSFAWPSGKGNDGGPDFPVLVDNLAADVTSDMLVETFRQKYPSVKGGMVLVHRITKCPKGHGYVVFGIESEQLHALREMDGVFCSTKPMEISLAVNVRSKERQYVRHPAYLKYILRDGTEDIETKTVRVHNLSDTVTKHDLRQVFGQVGEVHSIGLIQFSSCACIRYVNSGDAERAFLELNGTCLGDRNIVLKYCGSSEEELHLPFAKLDIHRKE